MRIRKFPCAVLTLSLAVSTYAVIPYALAADAASPASLQEDPQQAFATFTQRLKLTPDQQTKIKPLFEARNDKIKAIVTRYSGDTSRSARMGALREAKSTQDAFSGKLKPLLTSDQQAEFEAMRAEGRARFEQQLAARQGTGKRSP
jgi:hypothetical protein